MHIKNLLSTAVVSLSYLSATHATAELDIVSPPSAYDPQVLKRGWSLLDTRQEQQQPPPTDPNGQRLVHVVTVSDETGALKFFPESIKAGVSDLVQFRFYPKNHTITESLFAQPCVPLPDANKTATRPGQKSGFVPVQANTTFLPIYNMIINDTKPMWIFCGQTPHCQKGMVMVINQNETETVKTLENYRIAAAQVALPAAPGGGGSSSVSSGGYGAPVSTPTAAPNGGQSSSVVTVSTATPAVNSGPSLLGTASGTASASIAPFDGGANEALRAWGSTWSVGLVGLVGMGVWL